MFLVSSQIDFKWVLGKTDSVLIPGNFFLQHTNPFGISSNLVLSSLNIPDENNEGLAEYSFIPFVSGVYIFNLAYGSVDNCTLLDTITVSVQTQETEVHPLEYTE